MAFHGFEPSGGTDPGEIRAEAESVARRAWVAGGEAVDVNPIGNDMDVADAEQALLSLRGCARQHDILRSQEVDGRPGEGLSPWRLQMPDVVLDMGKPGDACQP